MRIHYFQYVGPIAFLAVGAIMVVAGFAVPSGALTDDGHPLGPFLLGMGAFFFGGGIVWGAGAFALVRYIDRKREKVMALRARLRAHGRHVMARVVSCEATGYMNFENEAWTNLAIEIGVPGLPPRQHSLHVALPQAVLDRARTEHVVAVLVDPDDPDRFVLADGGG